MGNMAAVYVDTVCSQGLCQNILLLFGMAIFYCILLLSPLPDDKIFDCSKLKQIADDILKCI